MIASRRCKSFALKGRSYTSKQTPGLGRKIIWSEPAKLAETEGFEPSMELLTPYSLSRGAPSASRASLRRFFARHRQVRGACEGYRLTSDAANLPARRCCFPAPRRPRRDGSVDRSLRDARRRPSVQ